MAKMYYSVEEALARIGCTEDRLRTLVREGKLREFRDAGKLNYRVDEVEKFVAGASTMASAEGSGELKLEDTGEIPLTPLEDSGAPASGDAGSGAPLDLVSDSGVLELSGSATGLKLGDSGAGSRAGAAAADVGEPSLGDSGGGSGPLPLEDSGGGSGEIALSDGSGSPGGDAISLDEVDKDAVEGMKKDDTVITNIGISVFDDDDLEITADPMAKTLMTGGDEHLGLDGSGGGSGLLDLTRESDDTSLGAELLENIDMTGTAETAAQTEADDEEDGLAPAQASMPGPEMEPGIAVAMYSAGMVEPVSPAFTGLLAAGLISLGLLGATSIANAVRAWPTYLSALAEQFWIFLAGSLGLAGVCTLAGWFVGKQSSAPRSPRPPKAKKPKKPKKGKKSEESGEAPGVSAA